MGDSLEFDDVLKHYGVKGMRWGVRRTKKQIQEATPVSVSAKPGQKVVTKGGTGQKASEDALKVAVSKQKARASTTDSLSTKELQEMVTRINLEHQYAKLTAPQKSKGKELVKKMLLNKDFRERNVKTIKPAAEVVGAALTIGTTIKKLNL